MTKHRQWMRWIVAAATILVAALLIWQCIDLYRAGSRPENLDASGVPLTPAFTAEKVAARLEMLAPALLIYPVLVILAMLLCREPQSSEADVKIAQKPGVQSMPVNPLRAILYALAAAFILLGVMNGGWYDVLVKAINICTECIGLG